MRGSRNLLALSIVFTGDEPPSEFRIFRAGPNETLRGTFLFDEAAAKSVMAEYEAHGIDLMLDYGHASIVSDGADPALAGRAAGWFCLEVRNGELWAVNVRWTPAAAQALRNKEWRYMSPAFTADVESGRVLALTNVAITNLPATRRLEPLMAASITALGAAMNPDQVSKAIDALEAGDAQAALAILKEIIVEAAGGDPDATTEDAPPPVGDGGADEATEPPAMMSEDKAAVAASISTLARITDTTTLSAAVGVIETWRASHIKLEAETKKLAAERAAMELAKRKENAVTLTKLGAETPHTTGLAKGKLCKRLLDEPLDEQNARIASLLAAKGGKLPDPPKPPPGTPGTGASAGESKSFIVDGQTVTLDARELKICADEKCDPQMFATLKARRILPTK